MTDNPVWRPLLVLVCVASVAAFIHVSVLRLLEADTSFFVYPTLLLYACFLAASVFILLVLAVVYRKNKDQVGYAFLLLTSVKMVGAYFLLRPVLAFGMKSEKVQFFLIFAIFLALETICSSRMLNRK